MLPARIIDYLILHQKAVRAAFFGLVALLVVADALPFIVDKESAHTALEKIPGFWGAFGFAGCVLLIIAAKKLGSLGIVQSEDFYDE